MSLTLRNGRRGKTLFLSLYPELLNRHYGNVPEQIFSPYLSAHWDKLIQNTLERDRKYKQLAFPTQIQPDCVAARITPEE